MKKTITFQGIIRDINSRVDVISIGVPPFSWEAADVLPKKYECLRAAKIQLELDISGPPTYDLETIEKELMGEMVVVTIEIEK